VRTDERLAARLHADQLSSILGATVMPHALFNASSWATVNRLEYDAEPPRQNEASAAPSPASHWWLVRRFGSLRRSMHRRFESLPSMRLGGPRIPSPDAKAAAPAPSVASIKIHLAHATADIVLSLLCFALVVNSAILIVAAASFYFAPQRQQVGDLFDAFELIKRTVGHSSAILFAVALLAAGQSASLTVTLAGQLVSEGFIHWTTNPFWRRVLTRAIALLPSFTIAAAVGRGGLDRMVSCSARAGPALVRY
jgi:metal iron transporter